MHTSGEVTPPSTVAVRDKAMGIDDGPPHESQQMDSSEGPDHHALTEMLYSGASTEVLSVAPALVSKEDTYRLLAVNGCVVAIIIIGSKETQYLVVAFDEPDGFAGNRLIGEDIDAKYAIIGPRAAVCLNLATDRDYLATANIRKKTQKTVIEDVCLLMPGTSCQIGRAAKNDEGKLGLTLLQAEGGDETVSRKHVKLYCDNDGRLSVTNIHSTSGTSILRALDALSEL